MEKQIRTALISVFYKDGLEELLSALHAAGISFISTGGTRKFIRELGYECTAVEELTHYPEMLGGRVKTLHPAIFGGILGRRELPEDCEQMEQHGIPPIDLVIVDLYPFEETVAGGGTPEEIIEKIDIGGISLIRAAAKNFRDVLIVSSRRQYPALTELIRERDGVTSLAERKAYARRAFACSSAYDSAIFDYFDDGEQTALRMAYDTPKVLRYGENPHQRGLFFGDLERYFDQLHGKEISYNNLQDIDAGVKLISDFTMAPTMAILKHGNACGCASRGTLLEAWQAALAGDPVSAFGGVFVSNTAIDAVTAAEIDKLFFEVIVAPDYDNDALQILTTKKNRIILVQKQPLCEAWQYRSMLGGVLAQENDLKTESSADFDTVTTQKVTPDEAVDLVFANKLVKHSKSNAITLAKDSQLIASGVGQTSRIDALRQAIEKARSFGFDLHGAVMASDAFFPFDDCVLTAAEAGITAIIQPGGSKNDADSIAACEKSGIAMVITGNRHFKH